MTPAPPAPIFQLSDLNRHGKDVMDAARSGRARIRDADGSGFVLLREDELTRFESLASVAVNLATIERARAIRGTETLDMTDYAEWTWLEQFDDADLAEFVSEVRDALIRAIRDLDPGPVLTILRDWRTTARALSDDDRRAVLLGAGVDEADFVDVVRPESEPAA